MGFAGFASPTTPLGATDILLVEQGGNTRGLSAEDLGPLVYFRSGGLDTNPQTVADSTFDTVIWAGGNDPLGIYSTGTGLVTIPSGLGGLYYYSASIAWDANGTGRRILRVRESGAIADQMQNNPQSSGNSYVSVSNFTLLSAGDTLEFLAFQSSGGNLDLDASFGTRVGVVRVGPQL